jgi:ketosteroid isomerase-like protein
MMDTPVDASVAVGVHAAIAAYAHALDAGRTDDVVELFCPDGIAEIVGTGTFEGHDAIRAAYGGWAPKRPQVHLVTNTVISSWTEREATATSNVTFLQRSESGWAVRLVGRYDDTLHRHDGGWRFHHRVTTFLA